ncbi:hypothetical protein SESBI_09710 [Sesbania bispinosa]|nr:hypothetical protein SESBI_09710 [Sesbania bispinosa]
MRSGIADASTFDDQRSPSEDIEMSIPADHEREVMDHDDSKEQANICNDRGSQSLKVAAHDMHTSGSEPVNVVLQNLKPGVQAVNPGGYPCIRKWVGHLSVPRIYKSLFSHKSLNLSITIQCPMCHLGMVCFNK